MEEGKLYQQQIDVALDIHFVFFVGNVDLLFIGLPGFLFDLFSVVFVFL